MKSFLLIGVIYGLCALSASAWECSFNGRRKVLQVGAPDAAPPQQLEAPSPSAPSSPPLPPQSTVATRPTGADVHGEPPLDYDFYTKSCPSFQQIVKTQVARAILADSLTPAKLLRLFFHDCFVMGCDASLLLNSTVVNLAERDHANNFTVDKYSVIDSIKAELEKACQAIVSCADTLGAAAAEAVEQAGGPHVDLAYGRRDGLESFAPAAKTNLPAGTLQVAGLLENFQNVGLNLTDVVVLSGGHTIGQARCSSFADRFTPGVKNPFPDVSFGENLYTYCVEGNTIGLDRRMSLDTNSTTVFDNGYFRSLVAGRGILTSDNILFADPRTKPLVTQFAENQDAFFTAFKESMAKMGRIGVLTGTQGQIRKQCWVRNPIDANLRPEANMDFAPQSTKFCRQKPCNPTCSDPAS